MKQYLLVIVIVTIGVLAFTASADAAISLVNTTAVANNAAGSSLSSTLSVTVNNLLVLGCRHGTTFVDPTNVTDTIGNVFTSFANSSNSAAGALTGYWAISSGTNASDILSCNFASSVAGRTLIAGQYSGIATSTPLDATSTNATTTSINAWSAGPFTTKKPNEVIIGFPANSTQGMSAGAGYVIEASTTFGAGPSQVAIEDKAVTSIQTNVSTTIAGNNGNWMMIVGAFASASQPPTSTDALFFAGD